MNASPLCLPLVLLAMAVVGPLDTQPSLTGPGVGGTVGLVGGPGRGLQSQGPCELCPPAALVDSARASGAPRRDLGTLAAWLLGLGAVLAHAYAFLQMGRPDGRCSAGPEPRRGGSFATESPGIRAGEPGRDAGRSDP